jgi:OST3 / OST6 family, transporter family
MQIQLLTRASAATPVIPMDTDDFLKFAGGQSRPYSLIVFCNAVTIREAKSLKLHEYLKNLAVVAKQARSHAQKQGPNDPANKLFFVEIDMANSRDIFMALGVQNLPWALHIAPGTRRCVLSLSLPDPCTGS